MSLNSTQLFPNGFTFKMKYLFKRYQTLGIIQMYRSAVNTLPDSYQPKEWFNPVVDKYIPELANRLAQISADAVLNAARLRII
jgi:hypothetical protein